MPKEKKKYEVKDLRVKLILPAEEVEDDIPPIEPVQFVPQHPFRIYIVGSTGSGKTNVLNWMLTHIYKKYFNRVWLFSANYFGDKSYRVLDDCLNEDRIITDPDEIDEKLTEIFQAQDDEKMKDKRILVIIDDFMIDIRKCKPLMNIMTKGRAKGISVIIINQGFRTIDPIVRNNLSDFFFFRTNENEIKKVWEEFGGGMEFEDFHRLFLKATKPKDKDTRPFFHIDMRAPNKKLKYRRNLDGLLFD